MEIAFIVCGSLTGLIVGITGVGGGAIMTPALIFLFGVPPATAVGTDLIFATVTKLVAFKVHRERGTVDWQVVRQLAWGSLPAALVTVVAMAWFSVERSRDDMLMLALGVAIVLTSVAMLLKTQLHAIGRRLRVATPQTFKAWQPPLTVAVGVLLGAMVALTSIGAGALGTVMLVYLYPLRLTPARLVGTDIAHAIPLALVAGLGHLFIGNVDYSLLGWLLLGSLPGVWIGSHLSTRAPDTLLRNAIAIVLLIVGLRIVL
jgi:uncharacterized protein